MLFIEFSVCHNRGLGSITFAILAGDAGIAEECLILDGDGIASLIIELLVCDLVHLFLNLLACHVSFGHLDEVGNSYLSRDNLSSERWVRCLEAISE